MSMNYYAIDEYGLYIRPEFLTDDLMEKIEHKGGYLSEFCGEIFKISNEGKTIYNESETINDKGIYYLYLKRYPDLCVQAYKSINEAMEELETNYKDIIPDGYDVRSNLAHIIGTIYG